MLKKLILFKNNFSNQRNFMSQTLLGPKIEQKILLSKRSFFCYFKHLFRKGIILQNSMPKNVQCTPTNMTKKQKCEVSYVFYYFTMLSSWKALSFLFSQILLCFVSELTRFVHFIWRKSHFYLLIYVLQGYINVR